MHTVLIAEDDNTIRFTQKTFLEGEGYTVFEAVDGASLISSLKDVNPDTILLDIVLHHDNGIELISDIKKHTNAPIIIVSSKNDLVDKVLALEMGADDYMCKPVEMRELASRIKAHIRRYKERSSEEKNELKLLVCGKQVIDFNTYTVIDENGNDLGLTTTEFNLLAVLAKSPNIVFTRERLFDLLKHDNYESFDRSIDVQIARIRKKLGDDAHNPKVIKTVRNAGYIFIGDKESAN